MKATVDHSSSGTGEVGAFTAGEADASSGAGDDDGSPDSGAGEDYAFTGTVVTAGLIIK